jgi:hypothetical protein
VDVWRGAAYGLAPLAPLAVVGLLVLLLRWAFSRGHSLVARRARAGHPDEYGVLVAVAAPPDYVRAELARRALVDAGVRATVARTVDGPRIMVFPEEEATARRVLAQR